MSILDKRYIVTMPDGSQWSVPVRVIAEDRAAYYSDEFDGDAARSLKEDTAPLFEGDSFECADWARNNMNWDDVEEQAIKINAPGEPDYQEGWINGEWKVS